MNSSNGKIYLFVSPSKYRKGLVLSKQKASPPIDATVHLYQSDITDLCAQQTDTAKSYAISSNRYGKELHLFEHRHAFE